MILKRMQTVLLVVQTDSQAEPSLRLESVWWRKGMSGAFNYVCPVGFFRANHHHWLSTGRPVIGLPGWMDEED